MKYYILLLLILFSIKGIAQEEVKIPLTNPQEPGKLIMDVLYGSISVNGYRGYEIVVVATPRKTEVNQEKAGMKRHSNRAIEFSVEENNNVVKIEANSDLTIDYVVKVPYNFSLKLSAENRGDIYVKNVLGSFEISNENGSITLEEISGSVSADALNKDVTVKFKEIDPNAAMAFSSLNGDIFVTFPKDLRANLKIKTDLGEVFSDFDIQVSKEKAKQIRTGEKKYTVKAENWLIGSVNGGGPEMLFKTYNGDIIIRQIKIY